MNEDNLIPNSERTPSELREITRKGGINSGKSRRKKRTMKENLLRFLHLQMKTYFKKGLKENTATS